MGDVWAPLSAQLVGAWADLMNLLAVADATEEFYAPEDLAEELTEAGVDPELDTVGVRRDGTLIGYGTVRVFEGLSEGNVRADLGGGVHPEFRGQGIGRALMDRLESRAVELSTERHPGKAIRLSTSGGLEGASVRPLLEHRGYQAVRYFLAMRRPFPGDPIEEPSVPVELYRDDHDAALRVAHNDAFATHFGSIELSAAEWADGLSSRTFRPECTTVLTDDRGMILSYVMSYCYVPGELYIGRVGTIQSARGRGYARACVLAALRAGAEQGYRQADLYVDSINPTGAGALYESVGFHARKTFASYDKLVPPLDAQWSA